MNIAEIMTTNVVRCRRDETLADVADRMWHHDVGCLPVIDPEDHVVGMITDRDACMAAYLQGKPLHAIPVASAMADRVFACLATDAVSTAEALMSKHQLRRLPVIDAADHLVGLVSLDDIARALLKKTGAKRSARADEFVATLAAVGASPGLLMTAAE
jgi:CBS domain-containing protein